MIIRFCSVCAVPLRAADSFLNRDVVSYMAVGIDLNYFMLEADRGAQYPTTTIQNNRPQQSTPCTNNWRLINLMNKLQEIHTTINHLHLALYQHGT